MSWTEIDLGDIAPGALGSATAIDDLAADHDELWNLYAPPVMPCIPESVTETSTTARVRYRWRMRGDADLVDVRVRIYASAAAGSGTVTLTVGAVTDSETVTGSAATYDLQVTPAASGPVECSLTMSVASPGDSITLLAASCYLVPSALPVGEAPSGWRRALYLWGAGASGGDAIASEQIERLLRGPGQILHDRPALAYSALRDTVRAAKGSGDFDLATDAGPVTALRGEVCRVAESPRSYTLDVYLSGTGAECVVQVGAVAWEVSTTGWSSTAVTLGAGPHPVIATLTAGTGTARIEALQVWRL